MAPGCDLAWPMKIALVSPYDTAHPGGVFEHIGHLRSEFLGSGPCRDRVAPRGRKGGLEVRDGSTASGGPSRSLPTVAPSG